MSRPSCRRGGVPFFVLNLSDGRAKALFTVPTDVAASLVEHPVLCRGASFDLAIDVVSRGRQRTPSSSRAPTITTTTAGGKGKAAEAAEARTPAPPGANTNTNATTFLSTEFCSPDPEGTAQAISERLATRMGGPPSSGMLSHVLGV